MIPEAIADREKQGSRGTIASALTTASRIKCASRRQAGRHVRSNVNSQEPCNQDYYDHDAYDVKNVHWALRQGMRDLNLKHGAFQ
jgi:hypothetical protein